MSENPTESWVIGLCDDTFEWYLHWKEVLSVFLAERGETAKLLYFSDAAALMDSRVEMDVIFLDICLEGVPDDIRNEEEEDGIWVAEYLEKRQGQCQVVYLTNYLSYAVEAYRAEHAYFVLKEQFEQRLGDVFEKLKARRQQKTMCFSVLNGGTLILRPVEIHYFERNLRTTKVVADSGEYLIRDKLDALEEILPGTDMLRCHNSYIVNLTYVREMRKGCFILNDQTVIQISRGYTRSVKENFIRWASGQSGGRG